MARKPTSVARNAQEADKLIAASTAPPADDFATDSPAESNLSDSPVPAFDPTASAGDLPGVGEPASLANAAPADAAVDPDDSSQSAGSTAPSIPPADDFEQRYKVLQGKYTAETRRQRDEISELRKQIDKMQELLAGLSPKAEAAPLPEPVRLIQDREVEEYGPELLDAAWRFTMQHLEPRLKQFEDRLAGMGSKISEASTAANAARNSSVQSAREAMFEKLGVAVKDWRTLNDDPDFLEWLQKEDVFSGVTRQTLLTKAFERNDAPRVINFFHAFKAETTDTEHASGDENAAGVSPGAPAKTLPAGRGTPAVDPATLVAPGRGRAAPRTGTQQQIVWTPDSIAAFYRDVRKGAYRDKEDTRTRLEADIFAAQTAGRLQAS